MEQLLLELALALFGVKLHGVWFGVVCAGSVSRVNIVHIALAVVVIRVKLLL